MSHSFICISGSLAVLPTIFHLICGLLKEMSPKTTDKQNSSVVTVCINCIKTLLSSKRYDGDKRLADWHRLIQSSLATVIQSSISGQYVQLFNIEKYLSFLHFLMKYFFEILSVCFIAQCVVIYSKQKLKTYNIKQIYHRFKLNNFMFDISDTDYPGMDETTYLYTITVFIICASHVINKVPVLVKPCMKAYLDCWQSDVTQVSYSEILTNH